VVDVLIALLLIAAMLEVLVGRHSPGAPRTTLWFVLPAIAILVLPILARRRFPFAPAAHWLLAAGISFVDWRLIPFAISIFVVGLVLSAATGWLLTADANDPELLADWLCLLYDAAMIGAHLEPLSRAAWKSRAAARVLVDSMLPRDGNGAVSSDMSNRHG